MPSNVEQLSPSRVKFTVEIPFSDLKSHLDKAYQTIAQQVNIPGFRRGKVPASVIDQRYGRGAVLQEAINAALPTAYNAAVQEAKVYPLADTVTEVPTSVSSPASYAPLPFVSRYTCTVTPSAPAFLSIWYCSSKEESPQLYHCVPTIS